MSVIIHPTEQLIFYRPLTRTVKESLFVTNTNPFPIVFKVKTTAPKQYCVRPNAGRVEANSEIEVQIILQPFKEEPSEDYKCKDKFLVQTAPIPEAAVQEDIATMWSHIETVEKATMNQHKIKCVFADTQKEGAQNFDNIEGVSEPHSSTVTGNTGNAVNALSLNTNNEGLSQQQQKSVLDSSTAHNQMQQPISSRETEPVAAVSTSREANGSLEGHEVYDKNNHNSDLGDSMESATSLRSTSEVGAVPSATEASHTRGIDGNSADKQADASASFIPSTAATNTAPLAVGSNPSSNIFTATSNNSNSNAHTTLAKDNDKEKELKDAYNRIAELERQLNELKLVGNNEGLRARSTGQQPHVGNKKLSPTVQPLDAVHQHLADLEKPQPTEGYPPQVVLGVAALVFIFTYLFF